MLEPSCAFIALKFWFQLMKVMKAIAKYFHHHLFFFFSKPLQKILRILILYIESSHYNLVFVMMNMHKEAIAPRIWNIYNTYKIVKNKILRKEHWNKISHFFFLFKKRNLRKQWLELHFILIYIISKTCCNGPQITAVMGPQRQLRIMTISSCNIKLLKEEI